MINETWVILVWIQAIERTSTKVSSAAISLKTKINFSHIRRCVFEQFQYENFENEKTFFAEYKNQSPRANGEQLTR